MPFIFSKVVEEGGGGRSRLNVCERKISSLRHYSRAHFLLRKADVDKVIDLKGASQHSGRAISRGHLICNNVIIDLPDLLLRCVLSLMFLCWLSFWISFLSKVMI